MCIFSFSISASETIRFSNSLLLIFISAVFPQQACNTYVSFQRLLNAFSPAPWFLNWGTWKFRMGREYGSDKLLKSRIMAK